MGAGCEADRVLPTLTKVAHHTKSTNPLTCVDAYQTLPDPMLAMLKPLVFLDWSTNTYHPRNLGLSRSSQAFTNHYHRTEGDGGLGIDLGQDQTNRMGRTVKGGVVRWCGSMVMVM